MTKEIYLDNAATTKVAERVAERVLGAFLKGYGNASSQHSVGKKARSDLEKARKEIADFIGAEPEEIYFTSGGTEANNLALRGLARANPTKKHIITSVIEHPCVLETCRDLEKEGFKVDYVRVDKEGIVDVKEIERKITKNTLAVSIMHVNNEIGTVQPIEDIGEICLDHGVYFHTDAVQSFAKLPINVGRMNIDLMSVSGHKFHAPKGTGFLYVKKGTRILPIMTGGGQERGLRSGTENVPGILGLAEAIKANNHSKEIMKVRNHLMKELLEIPGTRLNGSEKKRIFNNVNVSFYGIEGESLMLMLDKEGICVSTGSACASNKLSESHVLKAIEVDEMYIHGSIRLTLDEHSGKEINFVIEKIKEKVEKLRSISPFKLNLEEANEKKI
jgi:cysteine desulfurase